MLLPENEKSLKLSSR